MRAYLDANLYVSYLLNPQSTSPPGAIARAGFARQFTILLSDPTLREVLNKVFTRPSFMDCVSQDAVDDFLRLLAATGEHLEEFHVPRPAVGRDRKDDYLIARSVAAHADYLVSGDKDLLVLERVGGVRIVSPAEFMVLLRLETGSDELQ